MTQANRRTLLGLAAGLPLIAQVSVANARTAAASGPAPKADRDAILAMAGTFKVRFDFRETVAFTADYKPIDPKVSGGHEVVRVIEDTGRYIALQHILVVEDDEGETAIVKHWRQDWTFEPAAVLLYQGEGHWKLSRLEPAARAGVWSQTVWQTDDSPRYGGVGRWEHGDGEARWLSDVTLRPLARRDAIRKPVYDRYRGTNRHAITPDGWVHEQDNAKLGLKDGKRVTIVHEVVLNSYTRFDGFKAAAADDYWKATKDYWTAVRLAWDQQALKTGGIAVAEVASSGSATGERLMDLGSDVAEGKVATTAAVAEAQGLIAKT